MNLDCERLQFKIFVAEMVCGGPNSVVSSKHGRSHPFRYPKCLSADIFKETIRQWLSSGA